MLTPQMLLDIGDEQVVDLFAGGGGASDGIEQAIGRHVDVAVNHDPEAIAMHAVNHPQTRHYCEDVFRVDPVESTQGRPVGLLWASFDCKHFSKAKGGQPRDQKIRALAWVVVDWARAVHPRLIICENVEEFQTWGDLLPDGRPDPAHVGETYKEWVRQLTAEGYRCEWRELRASDYRVPTIRKRWYFIARRDGLPIVWPEKLSGPPDSLPVRRRKLKPWSTAAECIDFTLDAKSIFDRPRPLVRNTMRRVAKGLWRHVLNSPRPYIVTNTTGHTGCSAESPLPTIATGGHHMLAQPQLVPFLAEHANSSNDRTMAANEPVRTICAQVKGGHFSVVAPAIVPMRGTSEAHLGAHDARDPLSTISAGGQHHALVGAHLVTIGYGERKGQEARAQDARGPMGTIVASNKHAVVQAWLVDAGHGEGKNGGERFSHGHRPATLPLGTVTAGGSPSYVASAFLEQANGGFYEGEGRPAEAPMSTITAAGSNQQLVTAYCIKFYGEGGQWQGLDEPLHTIPTKDRMALVSVVTVPAGCIAPEHLARARQCAALLREHLPEQFTQHADLVLMRHDGGWWVLVDITLRMLAPLELYRAQGFRSSYQIAEIPDPALLFRNGVQVASPLALPRIPLSKAAQVRMCGNSVCPPMAKLLVGANYRDIGRERVAA